MCGICHTFDVAEDYRYFLATSPEVQNCCYRVIEGSNSLTWLVRADDRPTQLGSSE